MTTLFSQILGPVGALVMALTILFGGWRKWWVFGWQYKDVVSEKNEWKKAALRGTKIAERVVTAHEAERKDDNEATSSP